MNEVPPRFLLEAVPSNQSQKKRAARLRGIDPRTQWKGNQAQKKTAIRNGSKRVKISPE